MTKFEFEPQRNSSNDLVPDSDVERLMRVAISIIMSDDPGYTAEEAMVDARRIATSE